MLQCALERPHVIRRRKPLPDDTSSSSSASTVPSVLSSMAAGLQSCPPRGNAGRERDAPVNDGRPLAFALRESPLSAFTAAQAAVAAHAISLSRCSGGGILDMVRAMCYLSSCPCPSVRVRCRTFHRAGAGRPSDLRSLTEMPWTIW
jgi:hypothetical protein